MMDIIKEYCCQERGYRFILRLPHYGHTVAHINWLYLLAKEDFGLLDGDKVEVVHYGGQRYKGTFGIEFNSMTEPPEGYKKIEQVESTL